MAGPYWLQINEKERGIGRERERASQRSTRNEMIAIIRNHVTDRHLGVLYNILIFHDLNGPNFHWLRLAAHKSQLNNWLRVNIANCILKDCILLFNKLLSKWSCSVLFGFGNKMPAAESGEASILILILWYCTLVPTSDTTWKMPWIARTLRYPRALGNKDESTSV